jgi:hypothetical protein
MRSGKWEFTICHPERSRRRQLAMGNEQCEKFHSIVILETSPCNINNIELGNEKWEMGNVN